MGEFRYYTLKNEVLNHGCWVQICTTRAKCSPCRACSLCEAMTSRKMSAGNTCFSRNCTQSVTLPVLALEETLVVLALHAQAHQRSRC